MEAMPMEDRYKELFNDPNLGNEDWLEPRPELLGSIKAELYPVKKDRRVLYIFLILGILTALFISYFVFSSENSNSVGELNNTKLEETSISENLEVSKSIVPIVEETIEASEINTSKKESTAKSPISNFKQDKINNEITKSPIKKNKLNSESYIPVLSSSKQRPNNFNNTSLKENKAQNILTTEELDQNVLKFISPLTYLKTINPKFLEYTFDNPNLNLAVKNFDSSIKLENKNSKAWGLEVGSGYMITDFILNSNYLAALNPADYTQEPGTGQYVQLGIYKNLNDRLSLKLDASYSRTVFNSGHNSQVIYSLSDENLDQSIRYDMPMATPLGFINSEIVIERASGNIEDQTDIVVDLQNQHKLNMIDLTAGADFSLINRNKLQLNVLSSYGITYLVNVENEFRSFTPTVSGFNSGASQITADQENINSLLPVFDLGVNAKYEIREGARIGIKYVFRSNLNPIFELNDFNSSMKRNQIGINFQLDLN